MDKPEENPLEVIKADIKEIKEKISAIEESSKKSERASWYHFGFSVGIACMIGGMALVSVNPSSGLTIFWIGVILALFSHFLFDRKVTKSKPKN